MAKRKRSTRRKTTARNPRRHSKRVSRVVSKIGGVRRRRRVMGVRRRRNGSVRVTRRRSIRRRRNPELFGQVGGKSLMTMIGGGLVGVAATKFLPTLVPQSIRNSMGGSKLVGVAFSVAGAYAARMLATKVGGKTFGEAVFFGGLMQAGSQAISAFAPPALAAQLALGEIVQTQGYTVPNNPMRPQLMPAITPANSQGVGQLKRFGNFR